MLCMWRDPHPGREVRSSCNPIEGYKLWSHQRTLGHLALHRGPFGTRRGKHVLVWLCPCPSDVRLACGSEVGPTLLRLWRCKYMLILKGSAPLFRVSELPCRVLCPRSAFFALTHLAFIELLMPYTVCFLSSMCLQIPAVGHPLHPAAP